MYVHAISMQPNREAEKRPMCKGEAIELYLATRYNALMLTGFTSYVGEYN